ncbi:hypothetical protein M413DRAFT_443354 [Hebeloma cylindrosporum]|uniref:Gpi1-domain-containing protein n=1 Tax=Hebeloma cylindrosporum TaxID=76867 RepID=A0A0C3CJT6_HEBCY|nr:hypothetical protein M413DRAFT_443354 [Hebeloma cylindrosporum h7]
MLPSSSTTTRTVSVFWPHGSTKSGVCYGWLKPAICIAGVVDDTVNPDALSAALSQSTLWDSVKSSCGGNPVLLGTCTFNPNTRSPVPSSLKLWGLGEGAPTFSFVLYRPHAPQSLRFYVIDPPEYPLAPSKAPRGRDFYEELARYDFTRPEGRDVDQALNDVVIDQINASFLLQTIINSAPQKSVKLLPTTASFLLTIASYLGGFFSFFLVVSRIAAAFMNLPLLPIPTWIGGSSKSPRSYVKLKDISATVQQLDVRLEQAVFFITQVTTLRRQNTNNIVFYSVRYTNFFNTAWLIMNDLSLGLAFGTFLSENGTILADTGNQAIQSFLFRMPREVLYWLDAWPAGLKLNAQLSRFYVNTLVGVIDTWESILPPLSPSLFTTLGFLSSVGGITLLLSLTSDLLSLFLTIHLRIGYEFTRAVYWAAGVRLGGGLLWGVFRGKRRNVLRNRTDTWSYDLDQLLFGTVLFTLLAFLFPTALVYYVFFAGLRLATLLVQASIETLLAFMHHFPLFALMLRVKDPSRLPGGVCFSLRIPSPTSTNGQLPYLILESQPISLSAIFFQYIELWNCLARHYNPLRLLYQVLSGQHLSSIPPYSIRYALEPEAGVEETGKVEVKVKVKEE